MIDIFYEDHWGGLIIISPPLDSALPIVRPMIRSKQKYGRSKPAKSAKQAEKV